MLGPDPVELRVIGCLIEKQRATPDQYPLSLNALRLACNQSTNRDPVVHYDEEDIRAALTRLGRRRWVRLASTHGSRAAKFRHLLPEELSLRDDEMSVLAVLMLRGPQTPGELKTRTERLHGFGGLDEVLATLERLREREMVAQLGRRPGQKEERWAQLLGDEEDDAPAAAAPPAAVTGRHPAAAPPGEADSHRPHDPPREADPLSEADPRGSAAPSRDGAPPAPPAAPAPPDFEPRVAALEDEVRELRAALDALRDELGA